MPGFLGMESPQFCQLCTTDLCCLGSVWSDKRQGSECRWSLPERGIRELMWLSCRSGDCPFRGTLGTLQSPSRLGDCPFHMALGLWVWSSFQRPAEQREGRSIESLPRAHLAMMSLFSFLSLALLLFLEVIQGYFSPPPPLSPELSFQVQGLWDTSSLPLSRREGGQGSGGQVLTVTLLDKVGQAFASKALEQRLISSGVNCFLPRMAFDSPCSEKSAP